MQLGEYGRKVVDGFDPAKLAALVSALQTESQKSARYELGKASSRGFSPVPPLDYPSRMILSPWKHKDRNESWICGDHTLEYVQSRSKTMNI